MSFKINIYELILKNYEGLTNKIKINLMIKISLNILH